MEVHSVLTNSSLTNKQHTYLTNKLTTKSDSLQHSPWETNCS